MAREFNPTYKRKGAINTLTDFNEHTRTSALLILKDDRVVHESYVVGSRPDTRCLTYSMAKSITSTFVGMAIEDGRIRGIDDPLTHYLPALQCGVYDGV